MMCWEKIFLNEIIRLANPVSAANDADSQLRSNEMRKFPLFGRMANDDKFCHELKPPEYPSENVLPEIPLAIENKVKPEITSRQDCFVNITTTADKHQAQ